MMQVTRALLIASSALLAVMTSATADPVPDASKGTVTAPPAAAANIPPVLSPADATTNDIHCLVIYMLMGGAEDAKLQAASVTGTLYFTGKLDGRDPNLDIEGHILSELPNLNGEFLKSEAQRCGAELTARGKNEIAMTEDLQQRVLKMKDDGNPP